MAEYEIWLTNDTGARLARLQPFWFQATRVVNDVGTCQLGMAPDFDTAFLKRDYMIQFWRAPSGGRPGMFRTYFLRQWRWDLIGEVETLRLYGRDMNDLLARRVVAYDEDSDEANTSTNESDDAIKLIVTENLITDTSGPTYGSRDYANLSVTPDVAAGPVIAKHYSRRRVLDVLQEFAESADTAGTRLYFDIAESGVSTATLALQFRTYVTQPGMDLTDLGVVFEPARGNFVNCWLDYDYTDEENYICGLGQGEGGDRILQESYDTAAITASAWNRREGIVNATGEDTAAGVLDQADSALRARRGIVSCGGDLRDTEGFRFGRDWNWGDVLRARYREREFDGLVSAISLSVDSDGRETVTGRLEDVG